VSVPIDNIRIIALLETTSSGSQYWLPRHTRTCRLRRSSGWPLLPRRSGKLETME